MRKDRRGGGKSDKEEGETRRELLSLKDAFSILLLVKRSLEDALLTTSVSFSVSIVLLAVYAL